MSCEKTIARATYSGPVQDVAANTNVPVGTLTTTTNCVSSDGRSVTIRDAGTYLVLAHVVNVATAAGALTTRLTKNGTNIAAAYSTDTVAAVGDYVTQDMHALVTLECNCGNVVLAIKADTATSVEAATLTVIQVSCQWLV